MYTRNNQMTRRRLLEPFRSKSLLETGYVERGEDPKRGVTEMNSTGEPI